MSTENITAFLTKLQSDAALADKVSLATAEALADLASREGLPFTAEEFLSEQASLADAELDAVSGGTEYINGLFGRRVAIQNRNITLS